MIKMLREARIGGAIEKAKEDILEILEERFGQVSEDIEETIEKIDDLKRPDILHRKSVVVKDLEDFRERRREGR